MTRVLICTQPQDTTAYVIAQGLIEKNAEPSLFLQSLIPYFQYHTFRVGERWSFSVDDESILSDNLSYDRVWLRRTGGSTVSMFDVHDDDQLYLKQIYRLYNRSLTSLINRYGSRRAGAVVNDYRAKLTAESKMLQLVLARELGLEIPDTILTNSPEEVAAFQNTHSGKIICKPLVPHSWQGDNTSLHVYTAIYPPHDQVPQESIRLQPAIFQQYVEKKYEARVVVFGNRQFGMKIDSQANERSKVDWRWSGLRGVDCEPYRLPDEVLARCLKLMEALDLQFGAFDFIVMPDDRIVFLEVNESGQFLFLEERCPVLKLADAFCHFLIHGSLDQWGEESASLSLASIEKSDGLRSMIDRYRMYPTPNMEYVSRVSGEVSDITIAS